MSHEYHMSPVAPWTPMFVQELIYANLKENIKAHITGFVCLKGQQHRKCFHVMMSSWYVFYIKFLSRFTLWQKIYEYIKDQGETSTFLVLKF